MVFKRKEKSAPEEEQQQQQENICLDGVAAEIKEEDELIIEDTGDHVRWCFIGIDDNEEEGQEFCHFHQNDMDINGIYDRQPAALDVSTDEIIEIDDDDEELDMYDSLPNLDDSCEIGVSNEPIQDSFIAEGDVDDVETVSLKDDDEVSCQNSADCTNNGYCSEEEPDKDAQEFMDENITPTRRKKHVNESSNTDNEECPSLAALRDLIFRKYIKIKCHLCEEVFSFSIYTWLRHMRDQHHDFNSRMLSSFNFQSENLATCKTCKAKILYKVGHLIHYIFQHSEIVPKILMCAVCNYTDSSVLDLQEHQKQKHPIEDVENYEECPKCPEVFKNALSVDYHFQTSHSREYWGKFRYVCHLCIDAPKFDGNRKNYYGHLIAEHKLNNWKILKFRKFDVGRYLQCPECLKIFTNTEDIHKLLGHYLSHQDYCFWSCKFCETTHRFNEWPLLHICEAMRKHYGGKPKGDGDVKTTAQKQISWNEFEVYVKHVCPFCKEEFDKFEDWRLHIREIHFIHTLEGLNMSIIPDDPEKLQCLQCLSSVTKSAVELHKHRFQHLPYQPYRCRHCAKSLATYNLALNHVLTRCKDEIKPTTSKLIQSYKLKTETECPSLLDVKVNSLISITCPLCNNKRFSDFEKISKHFRNVHDNFQQYFTKAAKNRKRKCKVCQIEVNKNVVPVTIAHFFQHLYDQPFKCKKCQRSFPVLKRAKNHILKYHYSSLASTEAIQKSIKKENEVHTERTQKGVKKEKDSQEHMKSPKILKKENYIELAKTSRAVKREKVMEPAKVHKPIKRESDVFDETSRKSIKTEDRVFYKGNTRNSMKNEEKSSKYDKNDKALEAEMKPITRIEHPAKVLKEFEEFITYACPECNESIPSLSLWEQHIQTQHTFFQPCNLSVQDVKQGKPKCKDCNLILPIFESRQRRHKLSHMPHTAFICSLCFQRFSQITALYIHMRKTHFAKCKGRCPLCRKMLFTTYEKTQHAQESHSPKEWPDDMCTMCFKTVPDVEHHIRVDHYNYVNRPKYTCEVCGMSYAHQNGLMQHMDEKHKHKRQNAKTHKNNTKANDEINGKGMKGNNRTLPGKRKIEDYTLPSERKQHKAKKRCNGIKTRGK